MSFIPAPPRSSKTSHFKDVEWSAEQADFAIQMVIEKLMNGDSTFKVKSEDYSHRNFTISNDSSVYMSVGKDSVFMILDNCASGAFYPSGFFWKDKSVKASIKQLLYLLKNRHKIEVERQQQELAKYKRDVAMKALFGAFPEAVTQEFEKHILGDKDGKESSGQES